MFGSIKIILVEEINCALKGICITHKSLLCRFPESVDIFRQKSLEHIIPGNDVEGFVQICERFHEHNPQHADHCFTYCIQTLEAYEPLDHDMLLELCIVANKTYPNITVIKIL